MPSSIGEGGQNSTMEKSGTRIDFSTEIGRFSSLGLSTIKCAFQFGPIFSHLRHVFKTVERCVGFKGI